MIEIFIWLFKFIPELVIYGLILAGLIGYLLQMFMPFFANKVLIKIGSIVVFVLGFYLLGMIQVVKEYESQRIEFENKLAVAEAQSQTINETIKYVYKDRIVKIKEKSDTVKDNIKNKAVEIDKPCTVTPDIVTILNSAAGKSK